MTKKSPSSPPLFSYRIETIGDESALVFYTDNILYTGHGIQFDTLDRITRYFIPYSAIHYIQRTKVETNGSKS